MTELELGLHDVASHLDWPETPDLGNAVRAAIPERTPARWPRRLALVAAVLGVALIAGGLLVPQARTSLLRFFGIGAVRIEYVEQLPSVRPGAPLDLGSRIDADDSPVRVLRSELLAEPDGIYDDGGVVTLLYGSQDNVRLLVTEINGPVFAPEVAKKIVGSSTSARFVRVGASDAEPGIWIEGEPHLLVLPGAPPRLASNTLVWTTDDDLTVRLEGATSLEEAVRIAESFE